MSGLKIQITRLRKELQCYDTKLLIITLNNGGALRVEPNDMIHVLCSIDTANEQCIVKAIREHKIMGYAGSWSMTQLIKNIIDSIEL